MPCAHSLEVRATMGIGMRSGWVIAVALANLSPAAAYAQVATRGYGPLPVPDPAANAATPQTEYRIGPFDTLEISVFGVESLTQTVQVDATGQIAYPMIGAVQASAKTSRQLADEIAARMKEGLLQAPQVFVLVKTSFSQKFTVEGAVGSPGVYDIQGQLTLLQAIATAKGLNDVANTRNVAVFRTINGRRMAGLADLSAIRSGRAEDPQIYPGDMVVVADSRSKTFFRSIVGSMPLFNLLLLSTH